MKTIRPRRVHPGDKVAAVTLSWGGPGMFPHPYEAGKQQLTNEFGLQVVEMPHTLREPEWITRNPEARAQDLMQAFSDPSIKAIFSTIGGDDSVRILPYLDLEIIHSNPKVFMGYSDTTITHFACLRAGLTSFYGPSIMAGFGENGGMFPYMIEGVRQAIFDPEIPHVLRPNTAGWTVEHLDWSDPAKQTVRRQLTPSTPWRFLQGTGVRRGHLLGGCADVLEFIKGTDWWPPLDVWDSAILFYETSEEAPSPEYLTRWLRNFASQGILQKLNGILFARPCGGVTLQDALCYDEAILKVVREENGLTDLPIITNMDFGHTDPMLVLPYGIEAEINLSEQSLLLLEPAVL